MEDLIFSNFMNFYLISNSFKSFYLFRKDIILKLSKKYNVILIANSDSYSNYFEKNKIMCKIKQSLIIKVYLKILFFL